MAIKRIPGYYVLYDRLRSDKYFMGYDYGFRVQLMQADFVFDPVNHKSWNNISSHALPSGNGYSPITVDHGYLRDPTRAGAIYTNSEGNYVSSARYKYNNSTDSVLWTASGGDIGPTSGACIWHTYGNANAGVAYAIVGYIDFGQNITITDGDTLKLDHCFWFDFVNDSEYISNSIFRNFAYYDVYKNRWDVFSSQYELQTSEKVQMALVKPSFVWSKGIKTKGDVNSADLLPAGNGYSVKNLKNPHQTIVYESDKAYVQFSWDNVIWIASGGDIGPTSGAILYSLNTNVRLITSTSNYESVNYPMLGYIDFLSDITVTDGQTLTVKNIKIKINSIY